MADAELGSRARGGCAFRGWSAFRTYAVRSPSKRLFKITSRDVWQVFLNHAREAPVPNLCSHYHLNGLCNESCFFKVSNLTLTGDQTSALGKWVEFCRARMPQQPADTAKKPKLVRNPENACAVLCFAPLLTLTNKPVGRVNSYLFEWAAAARMHASTSGSNSTHISLTQLDPAATLAKPCHKAKLLEILKDKVKQSWQLLLPKEGAFEQDGVADDHRSQRS